MKLELKHLAPYLPYKINVIPIMSGNIPLKTVLSERNISAMMFYGCNPILRPLSDLTKEIEVNGKRFVPYLFWDDKDRIELISFCATDVIYCEYLEYFIMQKLFEWHFDVFGLIENNLAIDINTL